MDITLVHKCADSLISLDIALVSAKELIYDTDGRAVIYKSMQNLCLASDLPPASDGRYMAPGIVPFPELISLTVGEAYPFGDDVLFRGNSVSLEQLNIAVDREAVTMLNRFGVFKKGSKALRNVGISEVRANEGLSRVSKSDMDMFLCDVMRNAQIVVFGMASITTSITAATQPNHDFKNIRSLDSSHSPLLFYNMLCLLEALPALERIKCNISGLGSELAHTSTDKLPDYITSAYNKVGKSLRTWNMSHINPKEPKETVDYIMLLALACPRLQRVMLMKSVVPDFGTRIAEALHSDPYRKYAPQLDRLLDALY
ncbi:hypothetical protein GGH92_005692 [Coemansia sp. RSA 2673]|nr:hypothetical protein GGH92_005692 [Coemansia sp. RSA 2673]